MHNCCKKILLLSKHEQTNKYVELSFKEGGNFQIIANNQINIEKLELFLRV